MFSNETGTGIRTACASCAGRARAVCGSFSAEARADFDRISRTIVLGPGETLVWEDEEAVLVGSVSHGLLKLTGTLEDGREQIFGLATAGDFVGRPYGTRSSYSVTALSTSKLCVLGRSAFERFAVAHPEVEHALLLRALDELDRARRWMLLLGRKSAGERVASLLLEFAQAHDGTEVPFPLTRQQMADLLGLSIETVSRQLTQLRHDGLITLVDIRHFRIDRPERLLRHAA